MSLISPDHAHLPAYVAALQAGWSPNSTRDVTGEQLAEIAEDADGFLRTLRGEIPGTVTLADGRVVERLPGAVFWLWDDAFCGSINLRYVPGTEDLPPHVSGHIGYQTPARLRHAGPTVAAAGRAGAGAAPGLSHLRHRPCRVPASDREQWRPARPLPRPGQAAVLD